MLWKKKFYPTAFLDVSQAFDWVWHEGLLYKLKKFFPAFYFLLLKFIDQTVLSLSVSKQLLNRLPNQSRCLTRKWYCPFLYSVFTHDIPKIFHTFLGTYADDTLIAASHHDPEIASLRIQNHLHIINLWANCWKIKIN